MSEWMKLVFLFSITLSVPIVIAMWGFSFHRCRLCGSRLTWTREDLTPDASYGERILHPYVARKCYQCHEIDVIEGLVVRCHPPDGQAGSNEVLGAAVSIEVRGPKKIV